MTTKPPWLPADDWGAYDLIPRNIEIGPECHIWSSMAFLHYASSRPCGLRMGRRSVMWGFTMLDLGPDAELSIGNFSGMLEVTVTTNGRVTIGDYALIGHHVTIAGGPVAGPPGSGAVMDPDPEPIEIGDSVFIAANSVILGGARIGDEAVVGAGTVVDGEVPPGATAFGNPFRIARA